MSAARLMRLVLLWVMWCSASSAALAQAVSARDDRGRTVRLPAPAQRIVALAPHAVELVFAAGGGARLVGVVAHSDYPAAAGHLPQVGRSNALDLERIAALKPDLIVAWGHGNAAAQLDRLAALGLPIFYSDPPSLDAIADNLSSLGQLMASPAQAQAAAAALRAKVAALRQRYASRASVSAFFQVWPAPMFTLGGGSTLFSDVLATCGGRNAFAALQAVAPTVDVEAVLAADPELILIPVPPDATASLQRWAAWPQLAATRLQGLLPIDADLISRPGPRLAEGTARVCAALDAVRTRRAATLP